METMVVTANDGERQWQGVGERERERERKRKKMMKEKGSEEVFRME